MAPVTREEFADLLRELDPEAFESFVAALWEARGRRIERREGGLIARHDGDEQRLWVATESGDPPADTDTLVAPDPEAGGVRTVDADELFDVALYAVDRETADALFREYLGRPPPDPSPVDSVAGARRTGTDGDDDPATVAGESPRRDRERSVRPSTVLLAAAIALAVAVGALGAPAVGGLFPPDGQGRAATEAAPPTLEPVTSTPGSGADTYPPGMSASGIEDADALIGAHLDVVTGQSYRWIRVRREYVDRRPVASVRERADVASPTVYRTSVQRGERGDVTVFERYANGTVQFQQRRDANGTTYSSHGIGAGPDGKGPYEIDAERRLDRVLGMENTSVAGTETLDGRRFYRVRLSGYVWPGIPNASGMVLVGESGFVRRLWLQYALPGESNRAVTVEMRYERVGNVTVSPPPWLEEAKAG